MRLYSRIVINFLGYDNCIVVRSKNILIFRRYVLKYLKLKRYVLHSHGLHIKLVKNNSYYCLEQVFKNFKKREIFYQYFSSNEIEAQQTWVKWLAQHPRAVSDGGDPCTRTLDACHSEPQVPAPDGMVFWICTFLIWDLLKDILAITINVPKTCLFSVPKDCISVRFASL